MSQLVIVRDDKFQDHVTPELHPESPKRLAAIDAALKKSKLIDQVEQAAPRMATEDEISVVHRADYIEHLQKDAERARNVDSIVQLDGDTYISAESYDTAKLAAGAGLVGIDNLKKKNNSFIVVRPPGHHALAEPAMGFCLFNNVAVAARYAQQKLGYKRIFIVDWDVHHGNGTQALFFNDPSVFFASFHQYPFWPPDSGWYTEDGAGEGKGYNMNIPLPAGTGDRGYAKAFEELVQPVCAEYGPDLIMLSAGYDAHQFDPLGGQKITTNGYINLSNKLVNMAQEAGTNITAFLEGGYNITSLSEAVVATMRVLNGEQIKFAEPLSEDKSPDQVDERISDLRKHFHQYWKTV
jgi:acetoin utilization deacetylase AcuC-like enzyme